METEKNQKIKRKNSAKRAYKTKSVTTKSGSPPYHEPYSLANACHHTNHTTPTSSSILAHNQTRRSHPKHRTPIMTDSAMTDVDSSASSVTSVGVAELRRLAVQDLAHRIDPNLMSDLNNCAPSVMQRLIAQHKALNITTARQPPPLGVAPPLLDSVTPTPTSPLPASDKWGTHRTKEPSIIHDPEYNSSISALKRGTPSISTSIKSEDDKIEQRKQLRAERNRQSAASSRERKKRHLRELQRRLELLTSENKRMEEHEIDLVRDRLSREEELRAEGEHLLESLKDKSVQHNQLEQKVMAAERPKVPRPNQKLPKPRTWDNSSLGKALRSCPF